MKAIIVEDSRLARVELKKLLEAHKEIEIIAECSDPEDGIEIINQLKPDLIFLDIQMPGKNGFELLDALEVQPSVIFTTGYDQYAIRSFEYDAVDYLLKPIEKERLQQSLIKLAQRHSQKGSPVLSLDNDSSVFIKDGENCWLVELSKIIYFESCGNYCKVFFEDKKPMIHKTLNQLEERLPTDLFFRVSRQHIINLKFIQKVEPWISGNLRLTLKQGAEIEISRRHTNRFKNLLSL